MSRRSQQFSFSAGSLRLRLALIAIVCLSLVMLVAGVLVSASPANAPAPCTLPGAEIITDPSGDETGGLVASHDIQSVSVAEPNFGTGASKLYFTLKMGDLQTLTPQSFWQVSFTAPDNSVYYVYMRTFSDSGDVSGFYYGKGTTDLGDADPESTYDPENGTITLVISNSKVGNLAAGQTIKKINAEVDAAVLVVDRAPNAGTNSTVSYTLIGNAACPGPTPTPTPTATPTPTPDPFAPRFLNYYPPTGLGADAGEPTIGITKDPATGKTRSAMFIAGTQTLQVRFDDCTSPATATWRDVSFPTTAANTNDPIIFTDRQTNRTFVSQLLFPTPTSVMAFTDNDGGTDGQAPGDWIESQGSGIVSGLDHQTVGGGPYHAPVPAGVPYPNAVYYCSQEGVILAGGGTANCALSVDGGLTFGPAVPIYIATQGCYPLHGHLKVAPDGTAYVPNLGCDGKAALITSEDNGATWSVRQVSTSSVGRWDPSVGIGSEGTLYFGYSASDGRARVSVSHDRGLHWDSDQDVAASLGIKDIAFPAVIAGDDDRAAFAFLGTKSPLGQQSNAVWHLYVATTFDGGQHWSTVDATPNDPVQRGTICSDGLDCGTDRNLLDFMDVNVDFEGRVLVAYADGCVTQGCIQSGPNDGSDQGVIARQSGGRRLIHTFDPVEPTTPGTPAVKAVRDSQGVVHVTWPVPDTGGSPITGYKVFRRPEGGQYTQPPVMTNVPYYDDLNADPAVKFFYKVTAINAIGESPACALSEAREEPAPPVAVSACNVPGVLVSNDTSDDAPNTPPVPEVDIKSVSIAEPYDSTSPNANRLTFTLKVGNSLTGTPPASSQWYLIWNRPQPDASFDRNYVAMKTDGTGAISYEYGKVSGALNPLDPNPNANTPTKFGNLTAGCSYDPATGTIVIVVNNSDVDNPVAGNGIGGFHARTFYNRADGSPVTQSSASDFSAEGSYTLVGNNSCRPENPPVASLVATPNEGPAPLVVNFDASGSADPDAGDTIATYTFYFGDQNVITQSSPVISHTYNTPGQYVARLTIKDSRGAPNINVSQVFITAGGATPVGVPTQPSDFDGDGRTDLAVWRGAEGNWFIQTAGENAPHILYDWGRTSLGDIAAPGDYDGDKKTDLAIFRPSEGNWYIVQSSDGSIRIENWGGPGDRPVPADFDGDGKTDFAVFRASEGNWYIRNSSNGTTRAQGWGNPDDLLVPGDYDGDGKADVAVFRPSDGNWYVVNSGDNTSRVQNWGIGGDRPVPGDYDGDHKTDMAVFRPAEGNWYIRRSSDNTAFIKNWGQAGDIPVPGDYDGDQKTDTAIWRPNEGNWYVLPSAGGNITVSFLGLNGDVPVPSAYIP